MKFPDSFYEYMKDNTLTGIKGGTERETFLQIWMVEVDGRVFVRSWNKSARSWFTEFIKTGVGQIQYGDSIINVKGKKVDAADAVQQQINKAYLEKYNQEHNVKYAEGITQPEYADYTMEFIYSE